MFIFLYGEDTYRSSQKLREIKGNFTAKTDPSGINIITFEGDNFDLEKFNNAAAQGGFLVSKRLIIVKNLLLSKVGKGLVDQLLELLQRQANSDNIFVFWENGLPDQRTGLFKLLGKNKKFAQRFDYLAEAELTDYLKKYLTDNDGLMEKNALTLLVSFVGNNLWQLISELDKLIAYKNKEMINPSDVKEFVVAKISENIFGLTDALAAGNKKLALKLLQDQMSLGMNEVYLLTMITRQFRILAEIKSLLSQKIPASQIAAQLKLHPYVVKKSLPQAQKFSLPKFREIYQQLVELDKKIKSTSLPANALLDLFIMQI
jgi:DNA polymerase-3 subunit delta